MLINRLAMSTKLSFGGILTYGILKNSERYLSFSSYKTATTNLNIDDLNNKLQSHNYYNLKTREEHLIEIKNTSEYDLIVIGGGATGAGVALDSSRKGLKTLVIDSNDFASGTSSKSSKLLHGGLRYLERVFSFSLDSPAKRGENYELVRESLSDKIAMLNSAPYMTNELKIILPCTNLISAVYNFIGLKVYNLIKKTNTKDNCELESTPPEF